MPAVSLTGQDTAQIDGIILSTLADGIPFDLTFPNEFGVVKAGKNGNSIYAKNENGRIAEVTLRVLLGGSDDKFLNSRLAQWKLDTSGFKFLTGLFIKRVGDGQGGLQSKVYNCTGGIFQRQVEVKTSSEGDTEQSVAIYQLRFGDCQVSMQ